MSPLIFLSIEKVVFNCKFQTKNPDIPLIEEALRQLKKIYVAMQFLAYNSREKFG
jgi:hypothetical protein